VIKKIIAMTVITGLTGCSSILSVENPTKESGHGLRYFMPKKDFLVTVTVTESNLNKVTLATTEAYADLSKHYVLKHGTNTFGRSTLNVQLNKSGLLTSARSEMRSGIANIFQNNKGKKDNGDRNKGIDDEQEIAPSSDQRCAADGNYTFIHASAGVYTDCGVTITITRYGEDANIPSHTVKKQAEASGVFYRQNQPYLMTASASGIKTASIVLSPSLSKVQFMPVAKTFFAQNKVNFAFNNGVPTQYQQGTDGEVVALFKLPAEILQAYFSSAGSVFDSFRSPLLEDGPIAPQQPVGGYSPPQTHN